MVEHSAFWEVHREVHREAAEVLGELGHFQGGLPVVLDHFPADHQQLNLNHH